MKKYLITACLFVMGFIVFTSEIIEIPFYYDKADGHIYIYAEIGNRKGFFIFDTGAPISIVFDKTESYTNFKKVIDNARGILLDIEIQTSIYSADHLVLAGNKLKTDYLFSVTDNVKIINNTRNIAGVIGLDIFKNKMFEISTTDRAIRIHNKKPDRYVFSIPIFTDITDNDKKDLKMFIPIKTDDKFYNALIDTGAATSIILPQELYDPQNGKSLKVLAMNKADKSLAPAFFIIKKESVELMNLKLENKIFMTNTPVWLKANSIIGMKFLVLFDMLFDLRDLNQSLFYYKQRIPTEHLGLFIESFIENIGILSISMTPDNTIIINKIIEHSPAWKMKLIPGTVITKINSRPILDYSPEDLNLLFGNSRLAIPVTITFIDKNGKEKTVKIKPKKML